MFYMFGRKLYLLIQGLNLISRWNVYKMLLNKVNRRICTLFFQNKHYMVPPRSLCQMESHLLPSI